MTDALYSDQVVLVAWDGYCVGSPAPCVGWPAEVIVLSDRDEIARWITERLNDLQRRQSPRGKSPRAGVLG